MDEKKNSKASEASSRHDGEASEASSRHDGEARRLVLGMYKLSKLF